MRRAERVILDARYQSRVPGGLMVERVVKKDAQGHPYVGHGNKRLLVKWNGLRKAYEITGEM